MLSEGMKVCISNDLKRTTDSFGISEQMKRMKGSIRIIHKIKKNFKTRLGDRADLIRIKDGNGGCWTFHETDLSIVSKIHKPKPPETFDVNNLME